MRGGERLNISTGNLDISRMVQECQLIAVIDTI